MTSLRDVRSPAARISSTRLLPADHGPRNVPKIPRAAMVARSSSVSKYSATRSATAIGPQRSRRYMSFLPSLRRARPVCSMPHRSPRLGSSMSGGVSCQRLADDAAHLVQRLPGTPDTSPHLSAENLPISCAALFRVVVENERAAVGRERSHADFGRNHVQPVLLQLHVADDVGTQRPGGVRKRGAAEAGMKFFGDGRAAGLRAALEHQRLESGFGQVEGGDQPVVAATDDDDVAVVASGIG